MNYDIIIFGATSFVGQILARYLAERVKSSELQSLRWAIAGRSKAKLEEVRRTMATLNPRLSTLDLVIADASDEAALTAMCKQTKVVVSTVGPYALYGEPLVKACATHGTHYCDLTGEAQWMRKMIEAYQPVAAKSGARIVHTCGFDSIPSDYGVWFLQREARQRFGEPCSRVGLRVKAMKGAASGGTVASIINVVKEAVADPQLRRELKNPYSICPAGYVNKTRQPNISGSQFDKTANAWVAPFVMAAVNTRVVFRSNALSAHSYGEAFQYDEAMLMGGGVKGRIRASSLTAGLGGFMAASAIAPSRWVLEKFIVPKPGEGPSPQAQEKGYFDLRLYGTTEDGQQLRVKVTGDRDPGYGSTAKMLGESALCLALDNVSVKGGFWTPTTAMGTLLLDRLQLHAGLKFELLDKA